MKVTRRNFCEQAIATSVMVGLELPSFAGDKVIDNCETNRIATSTPSTAKSIIGDFRFIDLFCGIGGFHQAMSDLGGKCVFACDIDADCRKTYQRNYHLEPTGDITKVDAKDIPVHDVLCAGFPCQAFSKAGNRLGFADIQYGKMAA